MVAARQGGHELADVAGACQAHRPGETPLAAAGQRLERTEMAGLGGLDEEGTRACVALVEVRCVLIPARLNASGLQKEGLGRGHVGAVGHGRCFLLRS